MVSISVLREICQQMDHFLSILHEIINIVTHTFQNYPLLNVCCLTAAMRMGNTAKFDDDLPASRKRVYLFYNPPINFFLN